MIILYGYFLLIVVVWFAIGLALSLLLMPHIVRRWDNRYPLDKR